MEEYKSLYEYLGSPAGVELGKEVYAASKSKDIKVIIKEISNKRFTGNVMTYPISFLDEFFPNQSSKEDEMMIYHFKL